MLEAVTRTKDQEVIILIASPGRIGLLCEIAKIPFQLEVN